MSEYRGSSEPVKAKMEKRNAQGCGFGGESAYTHRLSRSAWEKLIDEWIFSERDRRILKSRLLDGLTFAELSEEFYLSERQVKRIVARCTESLSRHI